MSEFIPYKLSSDLIEKLPIKNGQYIFNKDNGISYLDISDSRRLQTTVGSIDEYNNIILGDKEKYKSNIIIAKDYLIFGTNNKVQKYYQYPTLLNFTVTYADEEYTLDLSTKVNSFRNNREYIVEFEKNNTFTFTFITNVTLEIKIPLSSLPSGKTNYNTVNIYESSYYGKFNSNLTGIIFGKNNQDLLMGRDNYIIGNSNILNGDASNETYGILLLGENNQLTYNNSQGYNNYYIGYNNKFKFLNWNNYNHLFGSQNQGEFYGMHNYIFGGNNQIFSDSNEALYYNLCFIYNSKFAKTKFNSNIILGNDLIFSTNTYLPNQLNDIRYCQIIGSQLKYSAMPMNKTVIIGNSITISSNSNQENYNNVILGNDLKILGTGSLNNSVFLGYNNIITTLANNIFMAGNNNTFSGSSSNYGLAVFGQYNQITGDGQQSFVCGNQNNINSAYSCLVTGDRNMIGNKTTSKSSYQSYIGGYNCQIGQANYSLIHGNTMQLMGVGVYYSIITGNQINGSTGYAYYSNISGQGITFGGGNIYNSIVGGKGITFINGTANRNLICGSGIQIKLWTDDSFIGGTNNQTQYINSCIIHGNTNIILSNVNSINSIISGSSNKVLTSNTTETTTTKEGRLGNSLLLGENNNIQTWIINSAILGNNNVITSTSDLNDTVAASSQKKLSNSLILGEHLTYDYIESSNQSSIVLLGKYNDITSTTSDKIIVVGGGYLDEENIEIRKNIFELDQQGNLHITGNLMVDGEIIPSETETIAAFSIDDASIPIYDDIIIKHWKPQCLYSVETVVVYTGKLYQCIDTHESTEDFINDINSWRELNQCIRIWQSNIKYMANEIILYNNSLYNCKESHISNELFEEDYIYWNILTGEQGNDGKTCSIEVIENENGYNLIITNDGAETQTIHINNSEKITTTKKDIILSIPATRWDTSSLPYKQIIACPQITEELNPRIDLIVSEDIEIGLQELEAFDCITRGTTSRNEEELMGYLTLYCYKTCPQKDLNIIVEIV